MIESKVLCGKKYPLLDIFDGAQPPRKTFCLFEYTKKDLVVSFECYHDGKLKCPYTQKNSPVYRGDCVEVFISVGNNQEEYFEIDLAANNVLFCAKIHRQGEEIIPLESDEIQTYTKIEDVKFEAMLKIPFSFLGENRLNALYLNAFRVDCYTGDRVSYALFPTGEKSHHVPSAFWRLTEKD